MKLKTVWRVLKESFENFSDDKVLRLSGAMAYYAIFSIGPLLVLIVGLAGFVFGGKAVRHEVHQQLMAMVGEKSTNVIESMMRARHSGDTLMATVLGAVGLIFGAAGVFGQLQDALNTIWGVTPKPGHSLWLFFRDRFLSMAMVLGIGFLLLISMVLSTLVNAFAREIGHAIALPVWIAPLFNDLTSFIVVTLLFAAIFKVLPDVKLRWKDVWTGALLTAFFFTVGKYLLGLYLGRAVSASAYGAGSAFIVILMYVYYSSVILFFGAEFTKARVRVRGARIELTKYAMPVTNEQRAEQGLAREPAEPPPLKTAGAPALTSQRPQTEILAMTHNQQTEQSQPLAPRITSAPLERIKARPWSFVGLALTIGVAAGVLVRFKTARKVLRFYLAHSRT